PYGSASQGGASLQACHAGIRAGVTRSRANAGEDAGMASLEACSTIRRRSLSFAMVTLRIILNGCGRKGRIIRWASYRFLTVAALNDAGVSRRSILNPLASLLRLQSPDLFQPFRDALLDAALGRGVILAAGERFGQALHSGHGV